MRIELGAGMSLTMRLGVTLEFTGGRLSVGWADIGLFSITNIGFCSLLG